MPPTPLTEADLEAALGRLPGWTVKEGELTASYRADRARVPAFYAAVATAEDEADHHARITVLYGTVDLALTTHSAGGAITEKDTALAARISALAATHHAEPTD
ncbi:4a-hydroxytetrahydrobiopterin dehydratase [Streptomyces sp. 549]|uniref:4a-hydroxytetrahydrobiopterin dehydratase n=1 Tax=Streptomyces sp. 549 TaxID=3049076 RepID=UPI0024C37B43|nr:4a-hydroxytetrahydrobiopterin dehydratase [Streptomyces sp. 549]MDK1473862.1 4a-hydroxytetrahydrobiopterin dehydratase [Streptomyces sp. 549]